MTLTTQVKQQSWKGPSKQQLEIIIIIAMEHDVGGHDHDCGDEGQ